MNNYIYNPYFDVYSNYLAHHGVKGMHWGIRRYQPYPGQIPKGSKEVGQATKVEQRSDTDKNPKKDLGKYKNVAKALAVVGGLAVAGKLSTKIGNEYFDQVIQKGSEISTISFRPTSSNDKVYAAVNKLDKLKYSGYLPTQNAIQKKDFSKGQANRIIRDVKDNIRIPSHQTSKNIFKDMYDKDSDFKETVKSGILNEKNQHYYNTPKAKKLLKDARKEINKENPNYSKIYDAFNVNMVTSNAKEKEANSKFYKELMSKGYGGIRDVNDEKYSTYKTKSPLILFTGNSKVANVSIKDTYKQTAKQSLGRAALSTAINGIPGSELISNLATLKNMR